MRGASSTAALSRLVVHRPSVDARRRHLAETVDELVVRAHPKAIARRTTEDAKQRAVGLVSDDSGNLRYERVAAVAAAAVLLLVLVVVRRRAGRA